MKHTKQLSINFNCYYKLKLKQHKKKKTLKLVSSKEDPLANDDLLATLFEEYALVSACCFLYIQVKHMQINN